MPQVLSRDLPIIINNSGRGAALEYRPPKSPMGYHPVSFHKNASEAIRAFHNLPNHKDRRKECYVVSCHEDDLE